ncbi:MAG: hypothetical protein ACKVT2_11600 [Saprospiraceae bacterium]
MQQIVLNVTDTHTAIFLQFLQTLNYVQVLESPKQALEVGEQPHFLADVIGSMAGPEGDELAEIVSSEFQQIGGKW